MSRPRGLPKTGGRQTGTPNRVTAEVRELARDYGQEAIETLVQMMRDGETDTVRIRAAEILLERGYGKPMPI